MASTASIRRVKRNEIDSPAWDDCIRQSPNGLIYAHSFFLDAMSAHWDALIAGDYEWVMPLTWNRKYGISYLYQPAFCQQLGIFGKKPVPAEIISSFLQEATLHFNFAEIFLNNGNGYPQLQPQTNLVLSLNRSYASIESQFKTDLLKNLKHAGQFALLYEPSNDFQEAISHYRQQYADRIHGVKDKDYERFAQLCGQALKKDALLIRKVTDPAGGLHAIALFLKDKRRIYNLMSTVLVAGRQSEANHFLFDQLIREFSDADYILDFEGSSIPGIAHFYRKFGAIEEPYYFFRHNRLPWPVSMLK